MKNITINKRICFNCGSETSWIDKKGYDYWRTYKGNYYCVKCHSRLIANPKRTKEQLQRSNSRRTKEYIKKYNDRITPSHFKKYHEQRIKYKEKRVTLKTNPRTGYCSLCRNNIYDYTCKKTHIHHIQYHDNDPLKDTIEVCPSCHNQQRERQQKLHEDNKKRNKKKVIITNES